MINYDDLYIAKKIGTEINEYGDEIPYFEEPKPFNFSYMPTSGQVDYQVYGALIDNMYTAIIDRSYLGLIHSQDVAYLIDENIQNVDELASLDINDKYCKHANYRVKLVHKQGFKLKVLFEKITENGGN